MVGGLYDPLFASGLPGPPGAPIRRVWSNEGLPKFPRALWELGKDGRTGVKPPAFFCAGSADAWLLVGGTC